MSKMNLYDYCMHKVAQGASYVINFKTRSLSIGRKRLIVNGDIRNSDLSFSKNDDMQQVISHIEDLYSKYKHSIPSEKTDSKRRSYFFALKECDLLDEDMMYGEQRMVSMFELEYYILASILNGSLRWQDNWGAWFWQSPNDKDLVILRSWIDGE